MEKFDRKISWTNWVKELGQKLSEENGWKKFCEGSPSVPQFGSETFSRLLIFLTPPEDSRTVVGEWSEIWLSGTPKWSEILLLGTPKWSEISILKEVYLLVHILTWRAS